MALKPAARFDIKADDKTKSAFKSVKANLKSATSAANLMRGAVAGLAGAAAIGLLIKRSIDAADSVGKMADTIGISTDALQELRFAADLAGISTETFDKAMAGFSKRVGEARSGTGTLITLLNKLDPVLLKNVQAAQNTDEAFKLITESAENMGNELDKSALLAAAFGRTAGTQMKVLLKNGTEGLNELRQEAQDLGLVMSEVLIRQAEQAKDDMTRLSTVIKTQVTVAFAQLAPFISAVASNLAKATADAGGFGTVVVVAAESAAIGIAHVSDTVRGLQLAWKTFQLANEKTVEVLISGYADLTQAIIDVINILPGVNLEIDPRLAQSAFDAKVRVADLGIELQDLIEEGASVDKVRTFFATVREEAERTAELLAATTGGGDDGDGGGPAAVDEKAATALENLKVATSAKLEVIRAGLLSESEAETQSFLNKLLILEDNRELELISLQTFQTVKENLEQKHEAKLIKIQQKSLSTQQKQWAKGGNDRLKVLGGVLGSLTVLMNSESRKQFEIGKVAAISQTLIDTYVGAQRAFTALAGIPYVGPALGIAAAAAAIAGGLARVSAISSQSFGGGTASGGAAGGGTATPVVGVSPVSGLPDLSQQGQAQAGTEITIVPRDPFTDAVMRDFAEQLQDQLDDGVVISSIKVA